MSTSSHYSSIPGKHHLATKSRLLTVERGAALGAVGGWRTTADRTMVAHISHAFGSTGDASLKEPKQLPLCRMLKHDTIPAIGDFKPLNLKTMPNAAFMKPMKISADLAAVVGEGPMPRSEVVKKLWEYIKKNNLQDPANKRNINADANLKKVFGGKDTVNMFEMTKLVSAHLS